MTINEQSGTDKVIFKNGITFSQVGNYLSKSGDDLVLKINGSNTNKVTVKNFFLAGNSLVENFEFETGGALTAQQIFDAFGLTLPSTGGSGNQGSSEVVGDTTYNYTSGALTITEQSGNDKVIFKNGITFNQVGSYLTKSGDDLILKVNGSNTNKVTVKISSWLVSIWLRHSSLRLEDKLLLSRFWGIWNHHATAKCASKHST